MRTPEHNHTHPLMVREVDEATVSGVAAGEGSADCFRCRCFYAALLLRGRGGLVLRHSGEGLIVLHRVCTSRAELQEHSGAHVRDVIIGIIESPCS
jgi:hypothetical protein